MSSRDMRLLSKPGFMVGCDERPWANPVLGRSAKVVALARDAMAKGLVRCQRGPFDTAAGGVVGVRGGEVGGEGGGKAT
jgi:hypothetical protein